MHNQQLNSPYSESISNWNGRSKETKAQALVSQTKGINKGVKDNFHKWQFLSCLWRENILHFGPQQ